MEIETMDRNVKTLKCDFWNHQKLASDILDMVQNLNRVTVGDDNYNDLDCVPKMRRPYFWEFWKHSAYDIECQRILNKVSNYLEEIQISKNED